MNKKILKEKPIIGWREWLSIPEMHISEIKVKVDSGARTSAIHAEDIEITKKRGKEFVSFKIFPLQRDKSHFSRVTLPMIEERWVKSSVGHQTLRPVVKVDIKIGDHKFPIELTLVNRDIMGFRMLLGREAIKNRFLLDAGHSFLLGKKKKKK